MKRNYFRFKELQGRYLLTNELGRYICLDREAFYKYLAGRLEETDQDVDLRQRLQERYFLYDESDLAFTEEAGAVWRSYKRYLFQGTSLHIFVLTKQCNQQCVYCQASTNMDAATRMSKETAKKAVDLALQSPGKYLTFEFQGGEPLMHFDVLKYIVTYTEACRHDKEIEYTVVSNLMLLNDEMLQFFREHHVTVSTSLDGGHDLHNVNRPMGKADVFALLTSKMRLVKEAGLPLSAIQTTTRHSLCQYKQIVDQYVESGMEQIFLRPLTPLGYAGDNWAHIGYTAEEYVAFYRKALAYILDQNKKGVSIAEGHACLFLNKILNYDAGNYMELRSPCGGGIGQVAYYYDGTIYSCDEARMLAEMGDRGFALGTVDAPDWNELMASPVCRTLSKASCLEGLSDCSDCAYNPYCGTCPIISYKRYGTIYPKLLHEYRCTIYKGIQDTLFAYLLGEDESVKQILRSWVMQAAPAGAAITEDGGQGG